jgi:hypothetical protein
VPDEGSRHAHLATEFTALGVRVERPILNFDTLWQLEGS